MRKIFLNLLGINEQWLKKVVIEPKLIISFHNLSNDGMILLRNMLSSIGLVIDNKEVQIKESLPSNFFQNKIESQTIFLISDVKNVSSSKKVFLCSHPNEIINDSTLKSESWKVMVNLQKALNEVN